MDNSESETNKEINESQFFEENDLYISGIVFKNSLKDINNEFNSFEKVFKENNDDNIDSILSVDDIKINSLEQDVEKILKETSNSIMEGKHKKIFVLKNTKEESNQIMNNDSLKKNENSINDNSENKSKKINYLRNEAKVLEETISKLKLTDYQTMKKSKFNNCDLNSLIYFKNCKKEIGKENNYIFNYRDNFLNDMTKVDQLFFQDFFKPQENNISVTLIYEFSIYHPTKNVKTQQISILGDGTLKQLKDKIYCVLDEIQSESNRSFFFIEKIFYDDIPKNNNYIEPLSQRISELKLQKLSITEFQQEEKDKNLKSADSKFPYEKNLYCNNNYITNNKIKEYESFDMNKIKIEDIPLRIGYPYIFRHIESCDHVIILNDIRLKDKYDNFSEKDNKAIVTYQKKLKRKICDACKFYYAKFISINDIVVGDVGHALFLCDYCLKKLHQVELNENNTSNLKLIPYFHN